MLCDKNTSEAHISSLLEKKTYLQQYILELWKDILHYDATKVAEYDIFKEDV